MAYATSEIAVTTFSVLSFINTPEIFLGFEKRCSARDLISAFSFCAQLLGRDAGSLYSQAGARFSPTRSSGVYVLGSGRQAANDKNWLRGNLSYRTRCQVFHEGAFVWSDCDR